MKPTFTRECEGKGNTLERNTAIVTIVAIVAIVILEAIALIQGIDGAILSAVFVIIGGLAGFTLDRLFTKRKH